MVTFDMVKPTGYREFEFIVWFFTHVGVTMSHVKTKICIHGQSKTKHIKYVKHIHHSHFMVAF